MIYLCGELTADETVCHLIVTNTLNECIFSIPSPFEEDTTIDLYVTLNKNTHNNVQIVNGSPYVTCDVSLSARILSASEDSDYISSDNLALIEDYACIYIESKLEDYFYKTSKNYKSDIAMLGKYAVKSFTTWDEWTSYNWLENYTNSFFNVNVDVNIISSYLIS